MIDSFSPEIHQGLSTSPEGILYLLVQELIQELGHVIVALLPGNLVQINDGLIDLLIDEEEMKENR